jgi:hypothetical protein
MASLAFSDNSTTLGNVVDRVCLGFLYEDLDSQKLHHKI